MQIETYKLDRQTLENFADCNRLIMEVHERSGADGPKRFWAHFKRAEVIEGSVLRGTYGDGSTQEEAIANYGKQISEKHIVINAYTTERREIRVPVIDG